MSNSYEHIIYQVDSFTEKPFRGNPAGVMIIYDEIDENTMQNIAMEMNLSETAFVFPKKDYFEIRYFTPTTEVPLCGHATLASAHEIYENNLVKKDEDFYFKAKGGEGKITWQEDWITMDFPVYPINEIEIPDNFDKMVGYTPIKMYRSSRNFTVALFDSEQEVTTLKPDLFNLSASGFGSLIVTAKSNKSENNFIVRCFFPDLGIPEDPVTGAAHCALAPLWNLLTGATEFHSTQLSQRKGILKIKLIDQTVAISGQAVTIFKAKMEYNLIKKLVSD